MKIKILLLCFFYFTLITISCKKEPGPAIVGEWMNIAVYSDPAKGGYGWETVVHFHEYITFNPDAQFHVFTDVPGGGGRYTYNGSSKELLLQFEADRYGNAARSEVRKVEIMTDSKLIIAVVDSTSGMTYKTEYTRIN